MTETPHDLHGEAGAHPPPKAPVAQRDGDGTGAAPGRGFGLPVAVALVMGSIIGVGIFNLPTSLAFYGPITLVSMALTTVGAIALALLFAALSRRLPADGGPYAYSRVAFGNRLGFFNAWSYWITAWAGNAAIAVGWVLYVEEFINKGHNKLFTVLLVLVGLWLPAVINLSGVKNMGSVQVWTTVLKFAALAFMSTVGLFYISSANFTPWNISGGGAVGAIGGGMAIALFSYLGVEVASVAAGQGARPRPQHPEIHDLRHARHRRRLHALADGRVRHPAVVAARRTRPRRSRTAVNAMFGGTWAGYVMAVVVIISGFGALNGWTMICAEMPLAAANDGLFPERFKHMSKKGVPAYGIVASTVLASIAMVDQLHWLRRRHRLHHAGPDDRHHRRNPVRLLGARADQVALVDHRAARYPTVRARHGRRRACRWSSRSSSSGTRATPATASGCTGRRSS